jgi:hypothetical protein
MLTLFGVSALTFMMLMYALERGGRGFTWPSPAAVSLPVAYGFVSGAWPFGTVEAIWAGVALRRYQHSGDPQSADPDPELHGLVYKWIGMTSMTPLPLARLPRIVCA